MTENEVLEYLKSSKRKNDMLGILPGSDIGDTIIKALEELRQYWAIGTLEECRKSVEICKSMIERNITPENMEEYMKFEDECVKRGFTFESLLKARERQMAKKPRIIGNAMICPSCPRCFKSASPTYCPSCGQWRQRVSSGFSQP